MTRTVRGMEETDDTVSSPVKRTNPHEITATVEGIGDVSGGTHPRLSWGRPLVVGRSHASVRTLRERAISMGSGRHPPTLHRRCRKEANARTNLLEGRMKRNLTPCRLPNRPAWGRHTQPIVEPAFETRYTTLRIAYLPRPSFPSCLLMRLVAL